MQSLIQLIVVITMSTIFVTNVVDNIVRKWFGKDKVAQRKEYFTKYELWVKLITLSLIVVLSVRVGIDSSYTYILILISCVTLFGYDALLEKKYIENSKDYLFTFLAGLLKAPLMMILVVIYNTVSN